MEAEQKDKEAEKEKHKLTTSRLDSLRKDMAAIKEENQNMHDAENELKKTKSKLIKVEEQCQVSTEYKKKYDVTKSICLELEDQVKEYELVIEKLENMQQKLKESNEELKTKADTSGSELIKVIRFANYFICMSPHIL